MYHQTCSDGLESGHTDSIDAYLQYPIAVGLKIVKGRTA